MGTVPLLELLEAQARVSPDDLVPAMREVLQRAGLGDAHFYVVDYSQHTLQPLLTPGDPLDVDSTAAGRSYRELARVSDDRGDRRVWLPLATHGCRIGVLGLEPDASRWVPRDLERLAGLITSLMLTARPFTDQQHRAKRANPLEMSTELRWELLPPLSVSTPSVCIAGMLEPAYEVAGDSFDYAVNGDLVELAVLDAVGHGVEAARIVNLSIGAYRHLRREGAGLVGTYRRIDEVVHREFAAENFVAAHLAELDIGTGLLRWIAAGQPPPLLVRDAGTKDVIGAISTPMGMGFSREPVVSTLQLEPGDLLLFFSDGVVEARSAAGEVFGRELLAGLLVDAAGSGVPGPEMVRRLVHAVLEHVGAPLRDDATTLLVQWMPRSDGAPLGK